MIAFKAKTTKVRAFSMYIWRKVVHLKRPNAYRSLISSFDIHIQNPSSYNLCNGASYTPISCSDTLPFQSRMITRSQHNIYEPNPKHSSNSHYYQVELLVPSMRFFVVGTLLVQSTLA